MAISTILTVQYNANGGSGAPSSHSHAQSGNNYPIYNRVTLSSSAPSRSGYTFLGWADTSSATSPKYQPGAIYTYVFAGSTSTTKTFYAVWGYKISYNKGSYGSGTNVTQLKQKGSSVRLKDAIFTRDHYTQVGWTTVDGSAILPEYALNDVYSDNANITLYPSWKASNSIISSLSSWVQIGATAGTPNAGSLTLTRYNSNYLHRVEITFGSRQLVYQSVETSLSFAIPTEWMDDLPNTTNATVTCTVKTFEGSTRVGDAVSRDFKISVPTDIKPTGTLSGTNQSTNNTVSGWGVLVQGYSKIALSCSASAGRGATITSYKFTGDGVDQEGASSTVTSSLLNVSGNRTWKCTVTDSRGRSTTFSLSRNVNPYYKPNFGSVGIYRSDSSGNVDEVEGAYLTVSAGVFNYASCAGHNSRTVTYKYKLSTSSTWTQITSNASVGQKYIQAANTESSYNVQIEIVDALNGKQTLNYVVSSILVALALGLDNDRARFGGVPRKAGLEIDWKTFFDDDATVQRASGETGFYAERTDTGVKIFLGVGSGGSNHGLYSHKDGRWIIYDDANGVTRLPSATITTANLTNANIANAPLFEGHSVAMGTITTQTPSASSIANATWVTKITQAFSPGTFIVVFGCSFGNNGTGYRRVCLSGSQNSGTAYSRAAESMVAAFSGATAACRGVVCLKFTSSTTLYLNCYQNSGSSISTNYPYLNIIRIL